MQKYVCLLRTNCWGRVNGRSRRLQTYDMTCKHVALYTPGSWTALDDLRWDSRTFQRVGWTYNPWPAIPPAPKTCMHGWVHSLPLSFVYFLIQAQSEQLFSTSSNHDLSMCKGSCCVLVIITLFFMLRVIFHFMIWVGFVSFCPYLVDAGIFMVIIFLCISSVTPFTVSELLC